MLRTLFLLILICLSVNSGLAAADSPLGPKTYLPENRFMFEPVLEGAEVVHDFVIHNQGDEPLDILDIKSG